MPTIEATIITTNTTDRLATNGEGELPTGVPARNQGAVAAIDPHQAAAAAVMIGMDNATATANIPRILSLVAQRIGERPRDQRLRQSMSLAMSSKATARAN
jgi:hypothetical protein